MSETPQDPWATVRTFTQTRTGLWPSDSGMWYCRTEVDAARAAEATQHRQDRRRWAESLKEQHQRHVIESDALRKVLAAWEITANERSARLAAVEAERDRMKAALEFYANPFGRLDSNGERVTVPDFYAEMEFGGIARAALTPQGQSTDGETR